MLITGLLIGLFIGFLVRSIMPGKKKDIVEKYIRRGLLIKSYSISRGGKNVGSVEATYELGEIEATDELSKVTVISVKTDQSEYNQNNDELKKIISMVEESWIPSKEIKWITTIGAKRNEKIDEILGSNK